MITYPAQADRSTACLRLTPDWKRVCDLAEHVDAETVEAIVGEAAKVAEGLLAPLNKAADQVGCELVDGRVKTPEGYKAAYQKLVQSGWIAIDIPEHLDGQDLPVVVQVICQSLFDRACIAFMMAPSASRAAVHLLNSVPDNPVAQEWIPKILAAEWSCTICMSEAHAGSDVGRIRTKASLVDGEWRINGAKTWISYGDHDMAERIGHCMLARTNDAPGTRGLSLFLVPNTDENGAPNGIIVDRIEEKLGLHGSPTCSMQIENANGVLLGEEGRGLKQLFHMIEPMRLQVACQGLGLATEAFEAAHNYATERRQGGPADQPPTPIIQHPDIRRQLLNMQSHLEVLRLAVIDLAVALDLAKLEPDTEQRRTYDAYGSWLLPLVKVSGAETGFNLANTGIQIMGGVGYTQDYPLEQILRDSRVLSIYEGATGMQAQDFLFRRLLKEKHHGGDFFLARSRQELTDANLSGGEASQIASIYDRYEELGATLRNADNAPKQLEAICDPFLRLGWITVTAAMCVRMLTSGDDELRRLGQWRLSHLAEEAAMLAAQCDCGAESIATFFR